ncbi:MULTISPECIES: hypothetical protein [Deefgea]|uniref:Uncharacterized protein n=1 Tax=Deefgea chitinilytica TaxID=570276 RepID=A0ABS2C9A7_9NEIS|nr:MULTISPECIES: hypothetical protein [Deefgea]MBM5570735.1 hypothetical protein [Deefgea chitinilytica]MBM9887964.1 hypothetical protein [Deefgea sp. CFH1-16]
MFLVKEAEYDQLGTLIASEGYLCFKKIYLKPIIPIFLVNLPITYNNGTQSTRPTLIPGVHDLITAIEPSTFSNSNLVVNVMFTRQPEENNVWTFNTVSQLWSSATKGYRQYKIELCNNQITYWPEMPSEEDADFEWIPL